MFTYRSLIRLIALGCCLQSLTAINAAQQVDFKNVVIQNTTIAVLPDQKATINDHEYYGFDEYAKSLSTYFPTYDDVQTWNDAVMTSRIEFDTELKAPRAETTIPYELGGSRKYKNFKQFWKHNTHQNYFELREKWNQQNATTKKKILNSDDYATIVSVSGMFKDKDTKNLKLVSTETAKGVDIIHHNSTSNPTLYESVV